MQQQPIPTTPLFEGPAAELRAQQLGLPGTAPLTAALDDGASAARATTEWHPIAYRGQRMWGEAVYSLREGLLAHGWEAETLLGVDLVIERRRGIAIIVTAGDGSSGTHYIPQVRYERREVIQRLVNGEIDSLFDSVRTRPEWEIWFLLHFLTGQTLRGELSRPSEVNNTGWVTSWAERIILPEQTLGGDSSRLAISSPPEIEVDVRRRAV